MHIASLPTFAALVLSLAACSDKPEGAGTQSRRSDVEKSQALVLLRGLPTLGTEHSVAIVELNPDAANFGAILQEVDCRTSTPPAPPDYSPNGRLYSTGLDPKCSLPRSGCRVTPAGPR